VNLCRGSSTVVHDPTSVHRSIARCHDAGASAHARAMDLATRAELLEQGWTARQLTAAVRAGTLIRARRGWYVPSSAAQEVVEAARVGGLVGCLSLLRLMGIFVLSKPVLHVHMQRGASRMRSPQKRRRRLETRAKRGIVLHWHALVYEPSRGRVSVADALIHSVRCQPARHAIATIDSAVNKGLITAEQLADVFAALPERYRVLHALVDGRAESGPETLVRLMVRSLGCSVELQVEFDGVGFVDLVVDGWLVIECDSRLFHSEWSDQLKDYRRDMALAQQGYLVLRLTAEDIMYAPGNVLAAIRGVLRSSRGTERG